MQVFAHAGLTFAVLVASNVAWAQAPSKFPAAVQQHLTSMAKMCRESGGIPVNAPEAVQVADLTGDGVTDYVINEGAYNCQGAASLFSGSGGSQMSVYVSTPDGRAAKAFESGAFDVKLDNASAPVKVLVMVGGQLCGQRITPNMSRSDYKGCWRPIDWDAKSRKMQFAPVSRVRPV